MDFNLSHIICKSLSNLLGENQSLAFVQNKIMLTFMFWLSTLHLLSLPHIYPRPLVLTSHPKLCGSLERENEHGQLSCFSLIGSPGEAGSF